MNENTDLMRLAATAKHMGISEITLWRLGRDVADFPKKIVISPRCCAYRRSEIDAWLKTRRV
jgi:prophage regulatory protein